MSIQQYQNIQMTLYGDGISTTITVDVSNYLRALNTLPNIPAGIVGANSNYTISSFSMVGPHVTVVFATAPAAAAFPLYLDITF